jgi:hypothetical protein
VEHRPSRDRASVNLRKPRAPAVARAGSQRARWRIECGLRALRRVQTHEGAAKAVERKWPINLEQFRKWKGLGNDTVYATFKNLIPEIREATKSLRRLAQAPRKYKGISDELAKERAKNAELRQAITALTANLIQKGCDWDAERMLRIHYQYKLAELGHAVPQSSATASLKAPIPAQLDASVTDIAEHRKRGKAGRQRSRKQQPTPTR